MAMTSKPVKKNVLEILARGAFDGEVYKLPPDLPRGDYVQCNDALVRAGGEWDRKRGGHVFASGVLGQEALAKIIQDRKAPPRNPLAYWPTPDRVADQMVDILLQKPVGGVRLLEPSCGDGALIRAYQRAFNGHGAADPTRYTLVELDHERHWERLSSSLKGCNVIYCPGVDFLKVESLDPEFDRILMNPPFASESEPALYEKHIEHAWGLLAPRGRLVSVAPAGFTFDKRRAEFLHAVNLNGYWTELPDAAFRESGTGAKCVLVVLDRD